MRITVLKWPALVALPAIALMLGSCSDGDSTATGSSPGAGTGTPGATLSTSVVTFRSGAGQPVALNVEVADTAEKRARGLMLRTSLAEDDGMLFVFEGESKAGFYMKDTLIPLSIAFIDANGTIVDIQDMQPQTTDVHYSEKPYRYAVEANQGWYGKKGIVVGDKVEVPIDSQ